MYIDLRQFPLRQAEYARHAPDASTPRAFSKCCREASRTSGFLCTRDPNHKTEHVACVAEHDLPIAAWDDEDCEGY